MERKKQLDVKINLVHFIDFGHSLSYRGHLSLIMTDSLSVLDIKAKLFSLLIKSGHQLDAHNSFANTLEVLIYFGLQRGDSVGTQSGFSSPEFEV